MGRLLMLALMANRDEQSLQWQAGHDLVDSMTSADMPLDDHTEVWWRLGVFEQAPSLEIKRDALHAMLHSVERSMQWATTVPIDFQGWRIWVHGGDSHGDVPTEAFYSWEALCELPAVTQAVGFAWPPAPELDVLQSDEGPRLT